jgi:hypothetical protein
MRHHLFAKRISTSLRLAGLLLAGISTFAQDAPPRTSHPGAPPVRRVPPPLEKTPCWQKAGVSQDVMDKATGIRDNTRTQVSTVCADESLTHEQKLDQIAGLRKAAHEQIDALIPKEQQEVMRSCQVARMRRTRRRHGLHKTPDPCGYVAPTDPSASPEDPEQAAPPDRGVAPDKPAAPGKNTVPPKDAAPGKEAVPDKAPGKDPGSDPAKNDSVVSGN